MALRRTLLPLIFPAFLVCFSACREFEQAFMAEDTEIDPCDPTSSTYHGYAHFIERDFLSEDGTLDYEKWFEKRYPGASACNPIKNRKPRLPGTEFTIPPVDTARPPSAAPTPPAEPTPSAGAANPDPSVAEPDPAP